jgi:hypothetical protein
VGKQSAAPVDYAGAALAEGEMSKDLLNQQTWANRPNQVNPWGTVEWEAGSQIDPTTGEPVTQWTQNQTLSPAAQATLEQQMGLAQGRSELGNSMMGRIGQELGPGMNWDQFGQMQGINPQQQMSDENLPGLWGSVNQDRPQYQTSGTLGQLNFGGAPDVMNPQFGVQRAEDAIYDRSSKRLDDKFAGEKEALEIKLRNQGLTEGDQAWDSSMQSFDTGKNDAYQNAMNESIMGGGQEAQRMFGMESGYRDQYTGEVERAGNFGNAAGQQDFMQNMAAGSQGFQDVMQAANFQNQARGQAGNERMQQGAYNQDMDFRMADYYNNMRQQMINEEIGRRGQSLNEANALISGQQVGQPQFTGFSNAGVAQTPQMLAAAQMQGQQNAADASAANAGINGLMSGVGGLAGIAGQAGMFSDRRLKRNIQKIGERNGINWYEYDYVWGQHSIGVMADEVPHASFLHPSGYLMVDYSKV